VGRRLWYPDRFDVEVIADRLAARLFPGYEPLSAVSYFRSLSQENPLLESALALPRQPYYRTTIDKAGALLRSIVKNHPLVDGNKRLGTAVTFVFLLFNGYLFAPPTTEMVRFALELAASEPDMSWRDVAAWIRRHTVPPPGGAAWRRFEAQADPAVARDMLSRVSPWLDELETTLATLRREIGNEHKRARRRLTTD
jgi:death-on-curing protein